VKWAGLVVPLLFLTALWFTLRTSSPTVPLPSTSADSAETLQDDLVTALPPTLPLDERIGVPAADEHVSAAPVLQEGGFRFTDEQTGESIPGVTIEAYSGSRVAARHAADSKGEIKLPLASLLTQVFDCTSPLHFPRTISPSEFESNADSTSVMLVAMAQAGGLDVSVVDPQGRPVPDIFIEVFPWDVAHDRPALVPAGWPGFYRKFDFVPDASARSLRSLTDSQGKLRIPLLPVEADLGVNAGDAIVPQFKQVRIPQKPGTASIEFIAEAGAVVQGRLVSSAGTPQGAAGVQLQDFRGKRFPAAAAITNAAGLFRIGSVPMGKLTLDLSRYKAPNRVVEVDRPVVDLGDIVVDACVTVSGIIEVDPEVRSRFPRNVYSIEVFAGAEGRALQSVRPDDKDRFQFHVPAGPVNLVAYDQTIEVGRLTVIAPATGIVLPVAIERGGIHFRLADVGPPTVVRTRLRRVGVPGATYSAVRAATDDSRAELTWRGQELWNTSLRPGKYLLGVDVPSIGSADLEVELRSGEDIDLGTITVGTAQLSARVVDPRGDPMPSMLVTAIQVTRQGPSRKNATSGGDGVAHFGSVDCGYWQVSLGGRSETESDSHRLVLLEPSSPREVQLRSGSTSKLIVHVLLDGEALPAAEVRIWMLGNESTRFQFASQRTSTEGTCEFTPLVSGTYPLSIAAPIPGIGIQKTFLMAEVSATAEAAHAFARVSSKPVRVEITRDGNPFDDIAEVVGLGETSTPGRVVDRAAGLVEFHAGEELRLLRVRLASTTGKEKYGQGGEFIFARVKPDSTRAELDAEVCSGYLTVQLERSTPFPELCIESAAGDEPRLEWMQRRPLAWNDDDLGSRTYWGFPPGADLRVLNRATLYFSDGEVVGTQGRTTLTLR